MIGDIGTCYRVGEIELGRERLELFPGVIEEFFFHCALDFTVVVCGSAWPDDKEITERARDADKSNQVIR